MTKLYCAHSVLPVTSAEIAGGALAIEGEKIVDVGTRHAVSEKYAGAEIQDFGEAVILPGLVNTHSHLELTVMRGFLEREEDDFKAWLQKLRTAREERMTLDDVYVSAAWGAVEAARAGVTFMGDACANAAAGIMALKDVGLRGIIFQEAFGPDPKLARDRFEELRAQVEELRSAESERVRLGVSPHAPYTISAPLFQLIAQYTLDQNLPMMIHAAESEAEAQFMIEGRGPFAESLSARGIDWRAPGVSTIQYLSHLGVLRARPLLAHCVRVNRQDIETIKETGAGIAHCPKSNAKFGHGRAPFAAFIENDLNVGLGSDSVASNNTCDLLEEARFAALTSRASGDRIKERLLSAEDALRAATHGGARALGLEEKIGALQTGMQADFITVRLTGAHQLPVHDTAAALVFSSSSADVLLTVVAGREIFREGRVSTVDEEELRERTIEVARKLEGTGQD